MANEKTNIQTEQQLQKPDAALKRLEVLIGTWEMKSHKSYRYRGKPYARN
jgi:hypothetical protein